MSLDNNNVKLWLPFDGKDGATSTTDYSNSNHTVTFNGSTAIEKDYYYERVSSCYFPGSSYLSISDSPSFNFADNDFTIAVKFYSTNMDDDRRIIAQVDGSDDSNFSFQIKTNSSGNVISYFSTNGTSATHSITSSDTFSLNMWHNLIITRKDGIIKMYVNAVLQGTVSIGSSSIYDSGVPLTIGLLYNVSSYYFQGYMDELIIVNGEAWDDFEFVDSSLPLPTVAWPLWEAADGTRYDVIGTNHLTDNASSVGTNTDVQGYTCVDVAGTGSGDRLYASHSATLLPTQSIVVSVWLYFDSITGNEKDIFLKNPESNYAYYMFFNTTNDQKLHFRFRQSDNTIKEIISADTDISISTWHHAVCVAESGYVRLYIDNVEVGTPLTYDNTIYNATGILDVGDNSNWVNLEFDGRMSTMLLYNNITFSSSAEREAFISNLYNQGRMKRLELTDRHHPRRFYNDYLDSYKDYAVAGWNLDEMEGTRYDGVAHNHLADNNSVGYADDATFGRVADFEKDNSEHLGGSPILVNDGIIVSLWFNIESRTFGTLNAMVTDKDGTGNPGNTAFCISGAHDSDSVYMFMQNTVASTYSVLGGAINNGQWYHAVGVFYNNHLYFYLDGVEKDDTAFSGTLVTPTVFELGKRGTDYYDGKISNVDVWTGITFTDSTERDNFVSTLYNAGAGRFLTYNYLENRPSPSDRMVAAWGMQETSGNRIDERNGYVATDVSSVGYTTGHTRDNSANFSGSNNLEVLNSEYDFAELFYNKVFSLGFWIKMPEETGTGPLISAVTRAGGITKGLWFYWYGTAGGEYGFNIDAYNDAGTRVVKEVVPAANLDLDDNNWHRIWIVMSNDVIKIYNNEQLISTFTGIVDFSDAGYKLFIGAHPDNNNSGYVYRLTGQLQELVILDVPVDKAFIEEDYNGGWGMFYAYNNVLSSSSSSSSSVSNSSSSSSSSLSNSSSSSSTSNSSSSSSSSVSNSSSSSSTSNSSSSSSTSNSSSSSSSSSNELTWTVNNGTLAPLNPYLVAYWEAEDTADSVGSHTLTNVGSATFTAGKRDNAFTLDGAGQYFTAPIHADWNFGTDDFTISFWFKSNTTPPENPDTLYSVIDYYVGGSDANSYNIFINGDDHFMWYTNAAIITGTVDIIDNTWHHIVFSRTGTGANLFKGYVDGNLDATGTLAANLTLARDLWIGAQSGVGRDVNGQIDEIAIWKGYGMTQDEVTALNNSDTGAFWITSSSSSSSSSTSNSSSSSSSSTSNSSSSSSSSSSISSSSSSSSGSSVSNSSSSSSSSFSNSSSSSGDIGGIDEYTVLMLHCDGTDESTNFLDNAWAGDAPHTMTATGDVEIDTSLKKFGTGSGYFPGGESRLTAPDSDDWNFASNNFTIDFWCRFASFHPIYNMWIGQTDGVSNYWQMWYRLDEDKLYWQSNVHGNKTFSWNPLQDVWYHVAVVRNSNTYTFYIDGTSIGNFVDASALSEISGVLWIGWDGVADRELVGRLDEIRVSNGIARWTSNFTPPTRAYCQEFSSSSSSSISNSSSSSSTSNSSSSSSTSNSFSSSSSAVLTWTANNWILSDYDEELVSVWPFDEQSGTRYDIKGDFDLTANGSVGYVNDGTFGDVADFTGGALERANYLSTKSYFAMSLWVKFDDVSTWGYLWAFYDNVWTGGNATVNNDAVSYNLYNTANDSFTITPALSVYADTWYHLVYVFDKDDRLYIYRDGSSNVSQSPVFTGSVRTDLRFRVGCRNYGSGNEHFLNGKMYYTHVWDGIQFSNTAEREAFVDAIYNSGTGAFWVGEASSSSSSSSSTSISNSSSSSSSSTSNSSSSSSSSSSFSNSSSSSSISSSTSLSSSSYGIPTGMAL